jgi:hypothetical protein
LVGLALVAKFFACSTSKEREKDEAIQRIANTVSIAHMKETISQLEKFETRYPHEKQLEVADHLFERLKENVPNTVFHEYEYWGVVWKNVTGTIPGTKNPEEVYIACAHLDSKSDKRFAYAPGADDDASGCAAVLELARILSQYSCQKSVRFIFFSREETAQNGSKAYVSDVDRDKEKIAGVLNLDMIAYGSDDEDIDLVTRPQYAWIAHKVHGLANKYGIKSKKIIKENCY